MLHIMRIMFVICCLINIYVSQLVDLLLSSGSHVDQLDNSNQNPLAILQSRSGIGFSALEHISLKCLSAQSICKYNIAFKPEDLPRELMHYVEIHRPTPMVPDDARSHSPRSKSNRPNQR